MKKTKSIILFVLVVLLISGCGCKHQWKEATCKSPKTCELCGATEGDVTNEHWWLDATCTIPKTCEVCGTTEGESLGHKWESATCATPETCEVCGETKGEPLGHTLADATQIREASCAETGIVEGVCTRCSKTLREEVPMLEHTPGEWTISQPATYDDSGKKTIECTECSAIIKEETYELTPEEKEAWYKDACEQIPYKDLARTPDDYIGKRIKITGEVALVLQEADTQGDYSVYMIYTKRSYGFYFEDIFYVLVDNSENDSRILDGDVITFYGEYDGLYDEFGENQPKLVTTYYDMK